jgi:hypothetical protein
MSKDKLKFFLDTEFIELGKHLPLQLLSIGIVCENRQELYLENIEVDIELANDWVKENVFPHLKMCRKSELGGWRKRYTESKDHEEVLFFMEDIEDLVYNFIARNTKSLSIKPEFWGYFCDYDWVLFCQLFGIMAELPKGFPYWCRDLKQLMEFVGIEESLDELVETKSNHNALEDARQIKKGYEIIDARFDLKRNRFRDDK